MGIRTTSSVPPSSSRQTRALRSSSCTLVTTEAGGGGGDVRDLERVDGGRFLERDPDFRVRTLGHLLPKHLFRPPRPGGDRRPPAAARLPAAHGTPRPPAARQKICCGFWPHSKYDTVTPPPFARMSGMTMVSLRNRMSSASGVVGPFAPSAPILARTRGAFSAAVAFSSADGARMSTSSSRRSSFEIGFEPGKPVTDPFFSLWTSTSFGSHPLGL